jgi:hypothetical protein
MLGLDHRPHAQRHRHTDVLVACILCGHQSIRVDCARTILWSHPLRPVRSILRRLRPALGLYHMSTDPNPDATPLYQSYTIPKADSGQRATSYSFISPSLTTYSYALPSYRMYTVDGDYPGSSWVGRVLGKSALISHLLANDSFRNLFPRSEQSERLGQIRCARTMDV